MSAEVVLRGIFLAMEMIKANTLIQTYTLVNLVGCLVYQTLTLFNIAELFMAELSNNISIDIFNQFGTSAEQQQQKV